MSGSMVSSYTGLYALTWMDSASRLLAAHASQCTSPYLHTVQKHQVLHLLRRMPPCQFPSPQGWSLEGRQFLVLVTRLLELDLPSLAISEGLSSRTLARAEQFNNTRV